MSSPTPAVDGVNDLRRTNEIILDGLVRAPRPLYETVY
jgi:hypothetical protein